MPIDGISADVLEEIRSKVENLKREVSSLQEQIMNNQIKIDSWQRILDLARNTHPKELPFASSRRFSGVAAAEAAKLVLMEAGCPLNISEILTLLKKEGWTTTAKLPKINLGTMLVRSRKFTRPGPGVYGLPPEKQEDD